jgi:hypothetical protein
MTQINKTDTRKILEVSLNAPSSHNTQPWKVIIQDNGDLKIGYDASRKLPVGDPDMQELFISLGCFVESVDLAAASLGFNVSTNFVGNNPEEIVKLQISRTKQQEHSWIDLILSRRSDRRLFEKRQLPQEVVKELDSLEQGNAFIKIFSDTSDIDYLSKQTFEATLKAMSNAEFRKELSGWVRNNWTKQPDGMPGYAQGIPGPISLFAKFIVEKNKAVAKDQAKKDSRRIKQSSSIGLICAIDQSPNSLVDAGRLYQRACLTALKHDVKTSGISAAVIDVVTSKNICKKFDIRERPVALIRFGYRGGIVRKSPRLKIDSVAS